MAFHPGKTKKVHEFHQIAWREFRSNINLFATVERMICHGMSEESDINSARYKKFCRANTPEP